MDDQFAQIGHNSGNATPLPYDEIALTSLKNRVNLLAKTGGDWLDLGKIDSEERASKAVDFTAQVKRGLKAIEDERKKAKKPHIDAGKKVDEVYSALTGPLDKLSKRLGVLLTEYQRELQKKLDAERAARQAEEAARAAEARKAAEDAARRNDVVGEAEAEKAAKEAEKALKSANKPQTARIESATGAARTVSMRTYHVPAFDPELPIEVARTKAFVVLSKNPEHRAKLDDLLLTLAEAERRAKDGANEIAGIKFTTDKKAV